MEELDDYTRIRKSLLDMRKDTVSRVEMEDRTVHYRFAWEYLCIRLRLSAVIGPQGGISEIAELIDESKRIEADRLILSDWTRAGDGYFLPLTLMRGRARQPHANANTICRQYVEAELGEAIADPVAYAVKCAGMERRTGSVRAVSGGAPGLGKR